MSVGRISKLRKMIGIVPVLLLHGNAAMLASELGLHEWDVSLSHTEGHAIAFVVAFGR